MSKLSEALKKLPERDVDIPPSPLVTATCSTGSILLDWAIGGTLAANGEHVCMGLPRGKITEMFGPKAPNIARSAGEGAEEEGDAVWTLSMRTPKQWVACRVSPLDADHVRRTLATVPSRMAEYVEFKRKRLEMFERAVKR